MIGPVVDFLIEAILKELLEHVCVQHLQSILGIFKTLKDHPYGSYHNLQVSRTTVAVNYILITLCPEADKNILENWSSPFSWLNPHITTRCNLCKKPTTGTHNLGEISDAKTCLHTG